MAFLLMMHGIGESAYAGPVLHEFVPPPGSDEPADLYPGGSSSAIRTDEEVLPRPSAAGEAGSEERVLGQGATADRSTQVSLDRTTTHDGVLSYTAEFNPSVVPFKRMAAYDQVTAEFSLVVADKTLRDVPLSPTPKPPDHDAFWGSFLLDLKAGRPQPLPSVAPEARLVSYTTHPQGYKLQFMRDSADNYWVRSSRSGRLRLVILTDAPRTYFSPRIPAGVGAGSLPESLRPRLPAQVQTAAARVLQHIKVRADDALAVQLDRLVAYFRSFKPGELTSRTGSIYLDIALGQRGVCRHRALAFAITAQALGIPARYVHNEAHAFAEVRVPRMGWARIDLGGASSELRVRNAAERAVHRPGPDPFPRPASFGGSYTSGGGRLSGLDAAQRRSLVDHGARRQMLRPLSGTGREEASRSGERAGSDAATVGAARPVQTLSLERGGDAPHAAPPPRRATQLLLSSPARVVFRGDPLLVSGQALHAGGGIEGLTVEILLSRDGATGYPVGTLVSGPDGHFRGQLTVPRGVEVGEYKIYAETPGNEVFDGSRSR